MIKPHETFVDLLRARADAHGERRALTRWHDAEAEEVHVNYAELDRRARAVAVGLIERGLTGKPVLLLFPPGLDYVAAFFGCLYAGAIAVPYYPPTRGTAMPARAAASARLGRTLYKLQSIARNAGAVAALTSEGLLSLQQFLFDHAADLARLEWLPVDQMLQNDPSLWERPDLNARTIAFLQYTSGSTGSPKGVMLAHSNLLTNSRLIVGSFIFNEETVLVSWLPPYHDMGLIGSIMQPLHSGGRTVLMAPAEFLQRPRRWLEAITRHRADIAGSPNFGYELCVRKVVAAQREGLDLSSWTNAFSGAEPVRADTLDRFAEAFASVGFRRNNFYPCYGLAEATLAASGGVRLQEPRVALIERTALERNQFVESSVESAFTRRVVGCGRTLGEQRLAIVNGETRQELPPNRIGEVWLHGGSVAQGYWEQPELTEQIFRARLSTGEGPFLRTGDLGSLDEQGNLFILGRRKDLIILGGANHHPGDIEASVDVSHAAVRPGCSAAFGVDVDTQEALVIVAEVEPRTSAQVTDAAVGAPPNVNALESIATSIRGQVLEDHEIEPSIVVLLAPGTIPKTSSGKIERHACREGFLRDELALLYRWERPAQRARRHAGAAPFSATEEKLARLWREVLGVQDVATDDDFFALGGHSLLATELVSRIGDELKVEVSLRGLAASPTLAALARLIDRGGTAAETSAVAALVTHGDPFEPFPLNDVQEAYLFGRSSTFELGNTSAQGHIEFETSGLDLTRFAWALNELIKRHAMLRAIVLPDGQQRILPEVPDFPIELIDLRGLATSDVVARLAEIREEVANELLPTDVWPLFEFKVCQLEGDLSRVFFRLDLLIADLHSLRLFWRELALLYQDPLTALPPVGVSFRDCVLHEHAQQESDRYRASLEYWKRRLPTYPPAPELPLTKSPRAVTKPRFVRRSANMDAESWARLKRRAAHARLTPSAVLLTAFSEVLATWSRHPRFTLNLTLFNRPRLHADIDKVVGDFTSLILLPVDAIGDSFLAFAKRVQERLWEALDHRHVSGVRVLRELGRMQGNTLRAAMPVVFTSALGQESASGEAPWSWMGRIFSSGSSTPQVTLDHQVQEVGGELFFSWDAVAELFPDGMLDELFAAYCHLLEHLADSLMDWNQPLPSLVPVHQMLRRADVNRTGGALEPQTMHGMFLQAAARQPDALAVISARGARLSYSQLERRSRRIACQLQRRGVRAHELVAVVMEKDWHQVAAVLGILRAGAAYMPVDPSWPKDRRFTLFEKGEARIALTQPALAESLEWPDSVEPMVVEDHDQVPALESALDPDDWDRLAYVIFTSGSTGEPKGVMIDHRGAVNTIVDLNARHGITRRDRVLAISLLSFDLSVYDVFGLLAAGGTIVIPEGGARREPAHWVSMLQEHRVTLWNSVPALLAMLVEHVEGSPEKLPASLRLFWMSGDWIPITLPDRIRALRPGAEIIGMGGATEASIWSIDYPIEHVDRSWRSVPYGKPMRNQSFHVFDAFLRPRPVWTAGELFIGGIGVALGYWRDQKKTAMSFIVHPVTKERIYRTGDNGRYLPDGNIEFLGREDGQVKIQGMRIELGEIETHLAAHPDVAQCVVVARHLQARGDDTPAANSNRVLVAYAVPTENSSATSSDLREWLAERVPAGLVPARIVTLTTLPLSANGKVDLKSLPMPIAGDGERNVLSGSAADVATIWADVLQISVEQVGAQDNFFDLGGNSVALVRIARRLSKKAGREIPVMELFERPTVTGMAQLLEGSSAGDAQPSVDRAEQRKRRLAAMRKGG